MSEHRHMKSNSAYIYRFGDTGTLWIVNGGHSSTGVMVCVFKIPRLWITYFMAKTGPVQESTYNIWIQGQGILNQKAQLIMVLGRLAKHEYLAQKSFIGFERYCPRF